MRLRRGPRARTRRRPANADGVLSETQSCSRLPPMFCHRDRQRLCSSGGCYAAAPHAAAQTEFGRSAPRREAARLAVCLTMCVKPSITIVVIVVPAVVAGMIIARISIVVVRIIVVRSIVVRVVIWIVVIWMVVWVVVRMIVAEIEAETCSGGGRGDR